jgi:hypothetical protein
MAKLQTYILKDWQLNSLNRYINAFPITTNDITNKENSVIFVSSDFLQNNINTVDTILRNDNKIIVTADFDAVLMNSVSPIENPNIYYLDDGVLISDSHNSRHFSVLSEFTSMQNILDDSLDISTNDRNNTFFALIGRHDDHRDMFVNRVYDTNIIDKGHVVYHDSKNLKQAVIDQLKPPLNNDNFCKNFDKPEENLKWKDGYANKSYYESYNLEVVLETTTKAHFITEKTIKVLSAKMPFLMIASPNFLKYLQNLGFKTFNEIWDESYDSIADDAQRIKCLCYILNDLISSNQIYSLAQQCNKILEHNACRVREIARTHADNKRNSIERIVNDITKY